MYNLAIRKRTSPPFLAPRLNPGPAEPEADMLPSEPARQARIDSKWFEEVLEFTYLGSSLNGNNKIKEEKNIRLMMEAYFSHLTLFKSNILSKRTKMKLYKTLIPPIVTYGA